METSKIYEENMAAKKTTFETTYTNADITVKGRL